MAYIIAKQTTGLLAGYDAIDISMERFVQFKSYCEGRFSYQMGGKCSNLGHFPPTWELNGTPAMGCDCSGYARAILWYSTFGGIAPMPDGSWAEDSWFKAQGFKDTAYANCVGADDLVRLCIHRPDGRGGDPTGHVWICVHGHSVESHGGVGPAERPWNWSWFINHVDSCFVLGSLV